MSIFDLSDNSTVEVTGTYDSNVAMEPIPQNTGLRACIDEACWDDYEGDSFIKLRWTVLDGEFKNRKVFHKVKVKLEDASKRDRHIRMLAAIDANSGGGLMRLGRDPLDADLTANLCNKPMAIKVGVWEINGKTGNWVVAVSALGGAAPVVAPPVAAPVAECDIPF